MGFIFPQDNLFHDHQVVAGSNLDKMFLGLHPMEANLWLLLLFMKSKLSTRHFQPPSLALIWSEYSHWAYSETVTKRDQISQKPIRLIQWAKFTEY